MNYNFILRVLKKKKKLLNDENNTRSAGFGASTACVKIITPVISANFSGAAQCFYKNEKIS